jgi:hypothetical protein
MLPRYRCPELVAPRRPLVAAPSSSPVGQEWGRGGDPQEMGQGEEIRRRWTRGGDPPKMGQGEDSRRPAGVPGGGGAVASHRKKKTSPAFFIVLTSGPLSISAQIEFSLPAQHLPVGPTYQIRSQFVFNSRSVQIAKNYLKSRGFLRLKRKVVVFRNFAFNVVVLCYLPTRRLTSVDGSEPLAATSFLQVGPAYRNRC